MSGMQVPAVERPCVENVGFEVWGGEGDHVRLRVGNAMALTAPDRMQPVSQNDADEGGNGAAWAG